VQPAGLAARDVVARIFASVLLPVAPHRLECKRIHKRDTSCEPRLIADRRKVLSAPKGQST